MIESEFGITTDPEPWALYATRGDFVMRFASLDDAEAERDGDEEVVLWMPRDEYETQPR